MPRATRWRALVPLIALLGLAPAGAGAPGWRLSGALEPSGTPAGLSVTRDGLTEVLTVGRGVADGDPDASRLFFRAAGEEWRFGGGSRLPRPLIDAGARVVGNGTGDLVAWAVTTAATRRLILSVRRGGEWGRVQEVTRGVGLVSDDDGRQPVAFNGAGEVLVAWRQAGAVRARVRSALGDLGAVIALSPRGVSQAPAVALSEAGDAAVIWRRGGRVEAAHRRSGGEFTTAAAVSSGRPDAVGAPQVALDAVGNAMAAWLSGSASRPSGRRVMVAEHLSGADDWSGRAALTPPATVVNLDLALAGDGEATLIYAGMVSSGPVRVLRRLAGGHWSRPLALAGTCCSAQLAVSSLGDVLLTAGRPREAGAVVLLRRAGASGWTRAPGEVGRDAVGPAGIAVGIAGDAAVAWAISGDAGARAAAYEAARPPVLRGLTGTAAIPGRPFRLRVALSRPGRVLVTVRPSGSRRVVGAFVAALRSRAGLVDVPPRALSGLRPGLYEILGDTGGLVLRRAFLRVAR